MKKLFALVLSLALVVAFAVPALASGWAQLDVNIPKYGGINFDVVGLEYDPNYNTLGMLYVPFSEPYPVVRNSKIRFVVSVTISSKLNPAYQALINVKGLDLVVSATNIDLSKPTIYFDEVAQTINWGTLVGNVFTDTFNSYATYGNDTTYSYLFEGVVKKDGKDTKISASLGFYNKWVLDATGREVMEIDTDADAISNYKVTKNYDFTSVIPGYTKSNYVIDICDSNGATKNMFVVFPVKGQKVDGAYPVLVSAKAGSIYAVSMSYNYSLDFLLNGAFNANAQGATYDALKAVYDEVFAFLGFNYAGLDYMTDNHFTHYKGTIYEEVKSITWPNGNIIVAPVSPELPQTGDNASIVGFAMIAVALVAAAVVTVKKVRA